PTAVGAWAHVRIDELVRPRDMAACMALKVFAMQNKYRNTVPLPTFYDADDKALDTWDTNCEDMFNDAQKKRGEQRFRNVYDHSTDVKKLYGNKVEWPEDSYPAYLTEVKNEETGRGAAERYLSVWIPKEGAKLDRLARLKLPASESVMFSYVGKDEDPLE